MARISAVTSPGGAGEVAAEADRPTAAGGPSATNLVASVKRPPPESCCARFDLPQTKFGGGDKPRTLHQTKRLCSLVTSPAQLGEVAAEADRPTAAGGAERC